jgi:hypothetical protein
MGRAEVANAVVGVSHIAIWACLTAPTMIQSIRMRRPAITGGMIAGGGLDASLRSCSVVREGAFVVGVNELSAMKVEKTRSARDGLDNTGSLIRPSGSGMQAANLHPEDRTGAARMTRTDNRIGVRDSS